MSKHVLGLFVMTAAVVSAAEQTPAPLPPEQAVTAMRVPAGFVATLVAAEPDVVQPISYCFDDRGRLIVAEALNYGEWQPTGKDRIVILADDDGDGRVDSRKVFFEGFNYITGIEVGFGGVWVMSPPNLYFVPDRDGDDQPDSEPQVLFDDFGYQESRHNLANGFTWGPDGWLYAGHGRTSPSEVGRPGTPAEQRIHCDGGVYRIHPTRLVFENFADGTTNPWGVDFDDFGQCFVSNCVNPHLFHVIQGAHYEPWRNRPSSLYAYDRIPTCADHLHYPSDQPKAMRGETQETLDMGGGHAHCGTLIYLGDNFPPQYRNTALMCNVHGRRINNDVLRRKGSGYVASHSPDLMIAGDPWFMGVTLQTGPDGSVFVSDWSDTGECHTYKPERGTGRIFKISHGHPRSTPVDLGKQNDDQLAQLLFHSNDWYVRHARRLLQERAAMPGWSGEAISAVLRETLANHPDVTRRLRALWTLHVIGGLSAPQLTSLLADRNEHIRAWAIQLLCENGEPPREALIAFKSLAKNDPSPVVRLYLAAALQRLSLDHRWDIVTALVSHTEDANDQNLPLMCWYGLEPLVPLDANRSLHLAGVGTLPRLREFIARRFVDHVLSLKEEGNLDALAVALAEASEPAQRDLLSGAREGLRGRKNMRMPAGWSDVHSRLKLSADPAIRELSTVLAVTFGDPQALADLRHTALTPTLPTAERQKALEALLDKGLSDLAPDLHNLLADKSLRRTALRGLASVSHEATPRLILARYADLTPDEKTEAVATLASRKDFALALLEAVENQVVARNDLSAYVARQLYSLGDAGITDRLRKVWGDVRETLPQKQEQIARYKRLLTDASLRSANVSNGRLVYRQTCQQCHVLFGEGSKIGPDLTGSNRTNLDYLLSNILDPSAEIGRDYRMSVVATTSGRILTGIVTERTPNRLTVQTATESLVISSDEVDEVVESTASMMPEGQFERLSREQIRDLIAYLATARQVSLPEGAQGEAQEP